MRRRLESWIGSALAHALGPALGRGLGGVTAFLLPHHCPACGDPADLVDELCPACRAAIPRLALELCARCCRRGLDPSVCRAHPDFRVAPAWLYDERAARVVEAVKYHGRRAAVPGLGVEMARAARPFGDFDLVAAVPLHPARRRERGYNQSALLARELGRELGVPVVETLLRRRRATAAQARLGVEARHANVAGAFAVTEPGWVSGRRVLMVDDVMTTGATLEACADALVAAGARVRGVTLAWAQ